MNDYMVDLDTMVVMDKHGWHNYPAWWINLTDHVQSDDNFVSMNGGMFNAITEYLRTINVLRVHDANYRIILYFESETDFLMLKLKWS